MDTEIIKQEIQKLIHKYDAKKHNERDFSEGDVEKDYIRPLFRSLGWNIEDTDEVSVNKSVFGKRPDYIFKINGIPKFFLEAKKFTEDLDDSDYIKQAINYAYLKGYTWAVLTNFKSIRIYNAELKSISESKFITIDYQDFFNRFDDLWLLSKESFEQGLLDKKAEQYGKKVKKISINEQLLSDFTRFRELLSKNISKLNQEKKLTEEELDESVQRILDRLIFIRNCEDKELEGDKLLASFRAWEASGKGELIKSLRDKFKYFDDQYNSKLFYKHLCDDLIIDNEILQEVIEGLYTTKDKIISYDFSVIDADTLGNIYEQYLGHILKKSEKRAKLTETHTHRKEQGIFYTPTYIVDYIVRNTLGELLKYKKTKVENIRVLDPACGSGSFLIKAFDVFNEYYFENDKTMLKLNYDQTAFDYKTGLPFTTKVKILRDNIFGVDLDKQAVEIAQLNLLLKIAEKGHRLPLLQQNIKCGNSLIDDKTIANDKTFKWDEEFNNIINDGGFDVIIGNPPYVQLSMNNSLPETHKKYLINRFRSSMGRLNTFGFFIKLGIDLLKEDGRLGFIVPNTILTQDYYKELREMILKSCKIEYIVNFSNLPFKEAIVENVIIILQRIGDEKKRLTNNIIILGINDKLQFVEEKKIIQSNFLNNNNTSFSIFLDIRASKLKKKIEINTNPLSYFLEVNQGIALKHERKKYLSIQKNDETYKKLIDGRNINRYSLKWDGIYLKYDIKAIHSCKREDIFMSNEKLFFRRVDRRLIATLDNGKYYALNTLVVMNKKTNIRIYDIRYFLAIFNSKIMNYYYQTYLKSTKTVFSEIQARQVKNLPIKRIAESQQQPLIKLVDKMLSLNKHLDEIGDKKTDERAKVEEEIKKTDTEIDDLVYKLYDITEAEKKIIEGN